MSVKIVGLSYQYGRKDPSISRIHSDALISYTQSVNNPQLFHDINSDIWCSTSVESPWGPYTVGINDMSKYAVMSPCPAGWHVATCRYKGFDNVFAGLGDGDPSSVSSGSGASYFAPVYDSKSVFRGRLYDDGATTVLFPGASYLFIYWGRESPVANQGCAYSYDQDKVSPYVSYVRGRLNFIRCVKN